MNTTAGTRRGVRAKVAAFVGLMTVALVGLALPTGGPSVGAQKVGNPGTVTFKVVGGVIGFGTQNFDLTPPPDPSIVECNDGDNNDGDPTNPSAAQDLLVDFPADPQCSAANDASEVQAGFQPRIEVGITGTVAANGAVTIPQSGIVFPTVYQYAEGSVLTISVTPTGPGSGNINPLTGAGNLNISLQVKVEGTPAGVSLGSNCKVGPLSLQLTTGTTSPPAGVAPITGVPYNADTGIGTLVDNRFTIPGASGCGPLGLGNGPLNDQLGLPAAAGASSASLIVQAIPIITKGVDANVVATPSSGFAPLNVAFNGTSSVAAKPIASYVWNYGDGSPADSSSGATAAHTYSTPGTYTASLTITDTDGDSDTQTTTITVNEVPNVPPTANIGSSGSSGIVPFAVTFDGSASSDSDGSITGYSWDFGDGSPVATGATASHTYATPGTYTATLTVTDDDGATGTATTTVTALPVPNQPPVASAAVQSIAGSIPLLVNLSAAGSTDADGTITDYAWDFGNGTTGNGAIVQATYTEAGSYVATVTVTDDDGATATASVNIDVSADPNIAPSSVFSADVTSGTAPLAVSFDGSASSDLDGTISGYAWNFGNGSFAAGPTASTTYQLPGVYTARLTVTDNKGATGTSTRLIVVNAPANQVPTAQVAATSPGGDAPRLVSFSSAGSVDPDGAITSYAWNFGNGTTSTQANPTASFTSPGTFAVTLTVTDNSGATAVASTSVTITPANVLPNAVFSATPLTGPSPLVVTLNAGASNDPDGAITSYAWDLGNGSTATGPTTSFTYTTPGSYTVKLTVTDNRGGVRTATRTVVAGPSNIAPVASLLALPTSGPAPLLVTGVGTNSTDADGTIIGYSWDFGNGVTGAGSVRSALYTTPGTYTVKLTVTDNRGVSTSATETIVVDPPVPPADRIRVQLTGAANYNVNRAVTSGNLSINRDAFGIASVTGTAGYAGSGGSTASITVNMSRFLFFNAYTGNVTINDPSNGVSNLSTPIVFRPLTTPSSSSVRTDANWITGPANSPYVLRLTVDDRA